MPFGGALTGGIGAAISGIAGLFGGGKQQKVNTSGTINNTGTASGSSTGTSTGSSTGSSIGTSTGTSTLNSVNQTLHQLSPFQQQLAQLFTRGTADLYNKASDLSGYTSGGLQQINRSSDLADQAIRNTLAARGLSYSPAAANAEVQQQQSRIGQQNQFLEGIPLLQRQLQQNALGSVMQGFSILPTDTTQIGQQTGTSTLDTSQQNNQQFQQQNNQNYNQQTQQNQTQQGTNLISGNPLGGLFSGLGAGLMSPNGSGGSNLSSILQQLFGGGNGLGTLDRNIATQP